MMTESSVSNRRSTRPNRSGKSGESSPRNSSSTPRIFHEAGHILNDSKREVFVDSEYSDDPREHAANSFAARFLIPARCDSELGGLKSRTSITEFSASIGIHPGIVVGRLQREESLPYSHLNSLKERFEWVET